MLTRQQDPIPDRLHRGLQKLRRRYQAPPAFERSDAVRIARRSLNPTDCRTDDRVG